jgi:hypothetical protein
MKSSDLSLEKLQGSRKRARAKKSENHSFLQYFKNPIIHKQIHGEHVYVPLNIQRVWNEI